MEEENYIPDSLRRFKQHEPFKVPEGYFDSLSSAIHEKKQLPELPQEKWYTKGSLQAKLMFFSMALVLALTLFTVYVISSAPLKFQFAQSYSASQVDSVLEVEDEDLIVAQLLENQEKTAAQPTSNKQKEIEYLLNEDIDIELVIAELN